MRRALSKPCAPKKAVRRTQVKAVRRTQVKVVRKDEPSAKDDLGSSEGRSRPQAI